MKITGYESGNGEITAITVTDETRGFYDKRFVPERPHGEWIEHRIEYMNYFVSEYECSNCHDDVWQKTEWQFCPSCGASMIKKEGEQNE